MDIQKMEVTRIDAIYARQSVDKADSISVESQIEMCKYETKGGKFQVFCDKGYSGKNTERPGFQQMLHEIRAGNIHRVICYKLDRCSRSILDFAALIEELQKYGVEFVSCTEKFDTSTPMGRAMLNICIVFAQLERETIQQRVYDAYHSRCRKGFYMGGKVPFGFRLVPCCIEGKRTSCYEAHPEEEPILRFLYEQYQTPDSSLQDVVLALNHAGIINPRRADGQWIRSHIGRMLRNPVYVKADISVYHYFKEKGIKISNAPMDFVGENGCYLYKDDKDDAELVIAPHKGLISSDVWLRCRKKHPSVQKLSDAHGPNTWLLGKLKCARCGRTLSVKQTIKSSGKNYRYILCPYAHGPQKSCTGIHGWKVETIEELVGTRLTQRLMAEFGILQEPVDSNIPDQNDLNIKIAQIQCEIDTVATKALTAGDALLPHFDTHIRKLERKKAQLLQQSLKNVNKNMICIQPDYDRLWQETTQATKRELANILIEAIRLSDSTAEITWSI